MKNLWLFFIRYNSFFWFFLFFVLSLVLVIRNNSYQRSFFVNSSNVVVGSFYEKFNSWKSYLALDATNHDLAMENAFLRQQLQSYILKDSPDSIPLADSIDENRYEFIIAEVVNNSVNQKSNYLTLNKGLLSGIEKGMGVIASNGVVGVVENVSEHFSTVRSLLHPDTKISVVLDEEGVFGSVVWGDNIDPRYAMVRDIPNHVNVRQGQAVRTSGYSNYPQGILIGEVEEAGIISGESFLDIRIKLSTNFNSLHHVYIVKDHLEKEKSNLETETADHG